MLLPPTRNCTVCSNLTAKQRLVEDAEHAISMDGRFWPLVYRCFTFCTGPRQTSSQSRGHFPHVASARSASFSRRKVCCVHGDEHRPRCRQAGECCLDGQLGRHGGRTTHLRREIGVDAAMESGREIFGVSLSTCTG